MLVVVIPTAGALWAFSRCTGRPVSRCICRCQVRVLSLAWRGRVIHFLLFSVDKFAQHGLRRNVHLFLLLFWHWGGIGQLGNLLPLLALLELLANRG